MSRQRETKRILLDASAEEFARLGLSGARMHAIVKRAGVTERMIYHHFGSKVGLYEAVLADQWLAASQPWEVDPSENQETRAAFSAALEAMVRGILVRPQFLGLVLHESLGGWSHVPKASLEDVPKLLRKLFKRGQREGVFRKDCRFEVVYLTALGAAVTSQLLAGRFSDLRSDAARDRVLRDALALVLEGASE